MGVLQQDGKPALVALRIHVEDGRITEAEHLIAGVNERSLANLTTPRPGLVTEIPGRAAPDPWPAHAHRHHLL